MAGYVGNPYLDIISGFPVIRPWIVDHEVAVGTLVTQRPPHGSGLALISASGSYRGCVASKRKWG